MEILLFAGLKEKAGSSRVFLQAGESISVKELKENIYEQFPEFEGEVFQVARNEAFVREDATLEKSDTIALIPPVSGG